MRRSQMTDAKRDDAGFTLLEAIVVVAIIMVGISVSIVAISSVALTARDDAAAAYVLNAMRHTRERAIDERRQYQIVFVTNAVSPFATINIFQGNTNAFGALVFTLDTTNSVNLPYDMQFLAPNPTPPTAPGGQLCGQGLPIDFSVTGAACGSSTILTFKPDGSINDVFGAVTNGTIFLRRSEPLSTRAVSFFGATGQTKGWRMVRNGAVWAWSVQ
jgi:type II secretory pathway pseudopilin PulG